MLVMYFSSNFFDWHILKHLWRVQSRLSFYTHLNTLYTYMARPMWGQLASMSASHCPGSSASGQRLTVSSWACFSRLVVDCLRSLRRAAEKEGWNRREIITVRGQSYVSRLPKYWPPTRRVCSVYPPAFVGGEGHTRRAEKWVGGQYFGRRET